MFAFIASHVSTFVSEVASSLIAFGVAMAINYITSLF